MFWIIAGGVPGLLCPMDSTVAVSSGVAVALCVRKLAGNVFMFQFALHIQ